MEPVEAIQQVTKEYIRQVKAQPDWPSDPLRSACLLDHNMSLLLKDASGTIETKETVARLRDDAIRAGALALRFLVELSTE